jgi:hypothetical protein
LISVRRHASAALPHMSWFKSTQKNSELQNSDETTSAPDVAIENTENSKRQF